MKWVGPEFKAQSSEVAIETLELAHEGLVFTSNATAATMQLSLGIAASVSVTVEAPEIDVSASISV